MKKVKQLFLITLLISTLFSISITVSANDNINVTIDGKEVHFDVQPTIINNRTMVPLRAIFEALGATVNWNEASRTVTSTQGDIQISLTIDQNSMSINDEIITLDTPATIVDNRTLVPVRAISEAFGCNVEWDNINKSVSITTNTVTRNSFIDFVKTYGKINDKGIYGFQTSIPYYSGTSGDSYGTVTLTYAPSNDELQLQVYEIYESNSSSATTVQFLIIDLPEKSNSYKWQFQYMITYPSYSRYDDYFMAAEGTLKANVESYLDEGSVYTSKIIIGQEITSGSAADNVGMLATMIPIYTRDMFSQYDSSLSLEYFGIK